MKSFLAIVSILCLASSSAIAGTVLRTTCRADDGSVGAAFDHTNNLFYMVGDTFSLTARGQTLNAPLSAIKQYRNSAELYLLIDLQTAGIQNDDGSPANGALEIRAEIQNNLPEDLWTLWMGTGQLVTAYDILTPPVPVRCEARQ